jgi:dTDP-glucose pyrophosphorylase
MLTIKTDVTLGVASERLSNSPSEWLMVVEPQGDFIGLISERIIRRAMLTGIDMETPVSALVEGGVRQPGNAGVSTAVFRELKTTVFTQHGKPVQVQSTPIVDNRDNLIVLMVGGEGTRLRPLTNDCPKPLLPVQGKPLLEITLERLRSFGYKNFCMTLGYKADMIVNHFGDGTKFGVKIDYVHERDPLGTAGALRLLPKRPELPILVMNGDVITGINFDKLFSFHAQTRSTATMCAYRFDVQLSYGVLTAEGDALGSFLEKPTSSHWINAGIYVLNPSAIDLVPQHRFDMPTLFQSIKSNGERASLYAMREQWIDIGSVEEYDRANHTPGIIPEPGPVAIAPFNTPVTSFAP